MNPQSTNRFGYETNQDIPRIIYRKAFTVTTTTSGSGYVELESTITADGVIIGSYNAFDLVVKSSAGVVYIAPIRTYTSALADDFWADIWLDSSDMTNNNSTATYRYKIRKYGGATTDSYSCWLIVWSTKISDYISLFDTSY